MRNSPLRAQGRRRARSFQKYYHLERYLFDEVGPRFRTTGALDPIDLYFVLTWKSNRAKDKVKTRLSNQAGTFQKAVAGIVRDLRSADSDELRLRVLMKQWG